MVIFRVAWFASPDIKFESSHTAKIKENLPFPVVVLDQFGKCLILCFGVFVCLLVCCCAG